MDPCPVTLPSGPNSPLARWGQREEEKEEWGKLQIKSGTPMGKSRET